MKQVFLIGDSIRLGYRPYVADELRDVAQVFSSDDNARFTSYTLRYLGEWARLCAHPETIDVVHFNNGLWDACHLDGDAEMLTPLENYVHNLERVYNKIRVLFPAARLIFALSTCVREGHPRISNQELDEMNARARALFKDKGVRINDLNAIVKAHPDYLLPDKTHMTAAGYEALGAHVAREIRNVL